MAYCLRRHDIRVAGCLHPGILSSRMEDDRKKVLAWHDMLLDRQSILPAGARDLEVVQWNLIVKL